MVTSILALASIEMPWMIGAYWGCLIVGGGFLAMSLLSLGSHGADGGFDMHGDAELELDLGDADFDIDVDAANADMDFDADAGHIDIDAAHAELPGDIHADAGHAADIDGSHADHSLFDLSSWFSMRFVVFFLAAFGAMGVLLSRFGELGDVVTALMAAVFGFVMGQTAHQIIHAIRRSSGNSSIEPRDFLGQGGRVMVAITPPDPGEIVVSIRGSERYVPAMAKRNDKSFSSGDAVVVIGYRGGMAEVISRREYDFLNGKD
jgi:hypothetical protein